MRATAATAAAARKRNPFQKICSQGRERSPADGRPPFACRVSAGKSITVYFVIRVSSVYPLALLSIYVRSQKLLPTETSTGIRSTNRVTLRKHCVFKYSNECASFIGRKREKNNAGIPFKYRHSIVAPFFAFPKSTREMTYYMYKYIIVMTIKVPLPRKRGVVSRTSTKRKTRIIRLGLPV